MSLTMTVVVVRDTSLDELSVRDRARLTFDAVYSMPDERGFAAAQIGAHVVALDPLHGELASAATEHLARQVYVVTLGGVSSTYVLQAFGPVTRLLVYQDGEVVENEGTPLPAEAALAREEFAEDAHLAVLAELMEAPLSALWAAPFMALTIT